MDCWSHSPWWRVPYSRRSGCWRLPDDSRDGRAISLVVHDASSVFASLGVERSSLCTGSVVWWTVRALAASHVDTVSSEAGSHDCHRSTASGTAEPPPDSHGDGGLETLSAVQRGRRLQARRSVLAGQPIGSVVASQACHGVMLASVLVVVCSLA